MKTKKKLLVSVLLVAFVVISLVSIIAIVFAASQQTVKTTININYTAEDIDAKVSARMTYQDGTSEDLGSIKFEAGNPTQETGSLSPRGNVDLSKENQYVIFEYTFQNTGDKDFVAMYDYTDTEEIDTNMVFGYKGEAENYKETANAILVNGGETKTYSVKVGIESLSRNAHLSGDMLWDMTSDIMVVTPDTIQEVVDTDINDKTIVLDEGNYTDVLNFRPSYETVTVYQVESGNNYATTTEVDKSTIGDGIYHFVREFNNVSFAGTENAIITELFAFESLYGCAHRVGNGIDGDNRYMPLNNTYDAVRNKALTDEVTYYSSIIVNNSRFTGLNFTGARGRIYSFTYDSQISGFNNVTIDNCSFETSVVGTDGLADAYKQTNAAIYIGGQYFTTKNENIVVKNNVMVENNRIENTTHNAIAIQCDSSTPNAYFTGKILIKNNYINNCKGDSGTGERAIRFNTPDNAEIIVENNTFVNCTDGGSLLKTQKAASDSSYVFTNNTYNGSKLTDANGTITTTSQWEYFAE